MVELEIFYAKRNRRGSIIVGECETFKSIKRRVIQKFSDHSDVEETTFSICIIELPQPFARQRNRNKFSPCETAKVSDLLASLSAINIVGSICLTIVDSRGAGVDTFTPIRAEELLHASLLATSDKLENYNYGEDNSCTSWATTGYNAMGTGSAAAVDAESSSPGNGNGSNDASVTFIPWLFQPVSVLDSLFDELSSTALIQGRLLKKIHSPRKQDNWR